jgi:hypothetical protein
MAYKATTTFSFDGKVYNTGDTITVSDQTAIDVLLKRKHIVEGKGKDPEPEPGERLSDSLEKDRKDAVLVKEKKTVVEPAKVEKAATGKTIKKTAKKK